MREPLLTLKQVAERLNVSVRTARRLIGEGKLAGKLVGSGRGMWRIPASQSGAVPSIWPIWPYLSHLNTI
ncbi:MAG TPA: helix-turn-helix domain-containing protein [Blastocatellia bacterium]|nr:helix-turn-helix domain-containing protein [Blastocatellia bacterium]